MMMVRVVMVVVVRGRVRMGADVRRLMRYLLGYVLADLVDPDLLLVGRRAEQEQVPGRDVLVVD